ncbi:MerR family transcriptional regulator [Nocardia sp. NPDC058705]|uniref:MerR family transcriptional regulator n=1 Tax=Nocardia sp. NPDC058705 TaxID=3346609 RepID=UPI0036BF1E6B
MTATVAIGEFARLTHLSVKTLRYYHEIELLEPATVDASTGYRRYSTEQVERAHLIRRLRDLEMPLPEIRTVLAAADPAERDTALRAHLVRMEAALDRTREVVVSLRALLTAPPPPIEVDYRIEPAFTALTFTHEVERTDIAEWCGTAFEGLYTTLLESGVSPGGVAGAMYSNEFFTDDNGVVTAFVPLPAGAELVPTGAFAVVEFPASHFAVAVHDGPFEDFDRTYGALGSYVAEHGDTLPDQPVRERYLVGPDITDNPATYRTEVCWPITEGEI